MVAHHREIAHLVGGQLPQHSFRQRDLIVHIAPVSQLKGHSAVKDQVDVVFICEVDGSHRTVQPLGDPFGQGLEDLVLLAVPRCQRFPRLPHGSFEAGDRRQGRITVRTADQNFSGGTDLQRTAGIRHIKRRLAGFNGDDQPVGEVLLNRNAVHKDQPAQNVFLDRFAVQPHHIVTGMYTGSLYHVVFLIRLVGISGNDDLLNIKEHCHRQRHTHTDHQNCHQQPVQRSEPIPAAAAF